MEISPWESIQFSRLNRLANPPLVGVYTGPYGTDAMTREKPNYNDIVDMMNKHVTGVKFDQDKPMWHLLDADFAEEVVKVMTAGASKYGEKNWANGMKFSRPFNALLRHLFAWWRGEENDPETGLSHMAHVTANAMFLFSFAKNKDKYKEFDDRRH